VKTCADGEGANSPHDDAHAQHQMQQDSISEQQSSVRANRPRAPRDEDSTSIDELYERVAPVVSKMVWVYLGNDAERDDVAQDILVSIMRGAASIRDTALLEGWASRVAFNTICNFLRRRKFRRWLSLDTLGEEQEAEQHADFEGRELVARTRRILESLALAERMPFTLELFGNASQAEIARVCGCSERTVRRRIKTAREHFIAIARTDPVLSKRLGEANADEESTNE